MSTIKISEKFNGRDYEIIAWANDHEVVYYEKFGSYQGDWLMVTTDGENYFIYKDYYGSCSGCDSFEAEFSCNNSEIDKLRAIKFSANYTPFLKISRYTMINLINDKALKSVFPRNIVKESINDIDWEDFFSDLDMIIKIRENLNIDAKDICEVRNAEIKQKALKSFGYDNFVNVLGASIIDKTYRGELIRVSDDILFIKVKDSSTYREYLLRVPPGMKRVKQAIAWTFEMKEEDYNPIIET